MNSEKLQHWQVGDVKITKLVEVVIGPVGADFFFPDATQQQIDKHRWLRPHFVDASGMLLGSLHTFIVETKDRRILVDTCIGNDKKRVNPPWDMMHNPFLEDLADLGYPVDSIDTVMCTHLHVDHVGWNTRLDDGKWVPTFPKARYLFARKEWEHWTTDGVSQITPDDAIGDSVRPILEAGLADLVEVDHRVSDEVWFEPTPGHSPAHVSVHIASRGDEAIITGDMIHHPLQLSEPDLITHFCFDRAQARTTRRAFLEKYQDRPVLVLGTHFHAPTAGYVVHDGNAWRLKY